MVKRLLGSDGVDLCVETFGDPADPTILLISGLTASMDWWDEEFCTRLADQERHVIRYDHRDTGESTSSPAGHPSYTGHDLATDTLRVLDACDVTTAHFVGVSAGGAMAQVVAAQHPQRVLTLTLIATSPAGERAGVIMAGIGVYQIARRRNVDEAMALALAVANPVVVIHLIGNVPILTSLLSIVPDRRGWPMMSAAYFRFTRRYTSQ